MSDSSFSDQVSGFPTENGEEPAPEVTDETTEEESEPTGPDPELLPEPVPVGPNTDTEADMETATVANSAFIPEDEAVLISPTEAVDTTEGPETVEQDYVIKSHMDPMRQKDAFGTYGDDIQRRQAEIERARIEDREPDFENMGPTVGDVVVTKEQAAQMSFAEPPRGVPVAFSADVVVGEPPVHDAQGNVPEEAEEQADA